MKKKTIYFRRMFLFNIAKITLPITIILIGIYLYNQNIIIVKQVQNSPSRNQLYSPTAAPSIAPVAWIKQNFNKNEKYFGEYSFPEELKKLDETNLVPFSCIEKYNPDHEQYSDYYYSLKSLRHFSSCQTYSGLKFIEYQDGENWGNTEFGEENYEQISTPPTNKVIKIKEKHPYFGCNKVLAITNSGNIYLNCGAGDTVYFTGSIYKIDIADPQSVKRLIFCEYRVTDMTTPAQIHCTN